MGEKAQLRLRNRVLRCGKKNGGPPGNRTPNLRIKSPLLCLIELEALVAGCDRRRVGLGGDATRTAYFYRELGWTMGLEP